MQNTKSTCKNICQVKTTKAPNINSFIKAILDCLIIVFTLKNGDCFNLITMLNLTIKFINLDDFIKEL